MRSTPASHPPLPLLLGLGRGVLLRLTLQPLHLFRLGRALLQCGKHGEEGGGGKPKEKS